MPGKISFHFDDGYVSHYTKAFPVFAKQGAVGCLCLHSTPNSIDFEQAAEMQAAGWEIISHSIDHINMNTALPEAVATREICESRKFLEEKGFKIRQFVTPMSTCHQSMRSLLMKSYDGAFTVYTNSKQLSVERLVIKRPVNRYELNRASLSGKSVEELKSYIDYVARNDSWLVFYDHDVGAGNNVTTEILDSVLSYCKEMKVRVLTSSQALDDEKCKVKIIRSGYDKKSCFVHARSATDGVNTVITAQKLDVTGCDSFGALHLSISTDEGHSFSPFEPLQSFEPVYHDGIRTVSCDMTPMYHTKTGKLLVIGATVDYDGDNNHPLEPFKRKRVTKYSVFDSERRTFSAQAEIEMPNPAYKDCSANGSGQSFEKSNGDLLIPFSYAERGEGKRFLAKTAVMLCSFDGTEITVKDIGNELEAEGEVRGLYEGSVIACNSKYYLTMRADEHGYVSESLDGLHYSEPKRWSWEDGEILPTYNTQSHWFSVNNRLFLVYTRKCGTNNHVFRHRAPLFVAEVNTESLSLIRSSEIVAVPERGARLGNFGVYSTERGAVITAAEWMQPEGCESYGSENAIWLSEISL